MCLNITKSQRSRYSKKDVKCYKVLGHNTTNNTTKKWGAEYLSPVYGKPYTLNDTKIKLYAGYIERRLGRVLACGGYLHTFVNLEDAEKYANKCATQYPMFEEYVVVESYIPSGTMFFKGMTDGPTPKPSYASKQLRVTDNILYTAISE
jgi:hypothetical protein